MTQAQKYFITGTDTHVGKTFVTACLMIAFQKIGHQCIPVKPVQTGCADGADDLAWCLQYSSISIHEHERSKLTPYRFPLAASPHLAARNAGESISIPNITTIITDLGSRWDTLLIEGAGGLLVPLNDTETMLDLIIALEANPIVVTKSSLGTLNHTALTLRELERKNIIPAAIIVNDMEPTPEGPALQIRNDNIQRIHDYARAIPVVGLDYQHSLQKGVPIPMAEQIVTDLTRL